MPNPTNPTEREKAEAWAKKANAIMKQAPARVWLYAASGTMWVMLANEDGERDDDEEAYSREAIVTRLDIPCDGGDF